MQIEILIHISRPTISKHGLLSNVASKLQLRIFLNDIIGFQIL
jgi:hypothetical protein